MIVTSQPDAIIEKIHKKLHRGATIIHNAEGTYNHQEKAVLLTVITRAEFNEFKYIMKKLILRLLSPFQKTFISLDALWKQKNKIRSHIVVTLFCLFSFSEKEPTMGRNRKFLSFRNRGFRLA